MSEHPNPPPGSQSPIAGQIGAKASRKILARKSSQGVGFGVGMVGLIGWSVVVPTLLGAALAVWLDNHYPAKHGWTLALLVACLVGSLIARLIVKRRVPSSTKADASATSIPQASPLFSSTR